jgi:hypothetical protein
MPAPNLTILLWLQDASSISKLFIFHGGIVINFRRHPKETFSGRLRFPQGVRFVMSRCLAVHLPGND